MKELSEEERDEQKEWISTVVALKCVPLYIAEGYETVGHSFMQDNIQKIAIRRRIERS